MEQQERLSSPKHKILLFTLLMGTILVPINSTMISIGLGSMAQSLHVSIGDITWLVTVYLLVMASVQPLSGKLNDMWGRKRTFISGAALFLLASVGCMTSANLPWLIVFRGLQALGGAVMAPAATALIRVNTSDQGTTRAFGIMSLVTGLGAAVGPLLGATLIDLGSWRWLFGVNVPVMTLCLGLSFFTIPESRGQNTSLDWIGSGLLLCVLLGGVLLLTGKVPTYVYTIALWLLIVILFTLRQRGTKHPLIPFAFFHKVQFILGNISILLSNFVMYTTILILPILLRLRYDRSLKEIGLLLLLFSVSMSIFSWIGATLSSKLTKPAVIGLAFSLNVAASLLYWFFLSIWDISTFWVLLLLLVFGGLAAGIGLVSMQTMSLEAVERADAGSASGIYSTFRYTGSILSSVAVAVFYHQVDIIFIAMAGLSLFGLLLIGGTRGLWPRRSPQAAAAPNR